MPGQKSFKITHHGPINKIFLSYSKDNSPKNIKGKKYEKWFNETNKEFDVDIDLQHKSDKIENFVKLLPYLDFYVASWDLFKKGDAVILEIDLFNAN